MIWALLGFLIASLLGGSAGQPVRDAARDLQGRIDEHVADEVARGRAHGDVQRFLVAIDALAARHIEQERALLDALRERKTARATIEGLLSTIDETRRTIQSRALDLQFDLRASLDGDAWVGVFGSR